LPTESAAEEVAKRVSQLAFTAEVKPAAQGDDWLCFATKEMVSELAALQKLRHDFDRLAGSLRGKHDGWGTPVVDQRPDFPLLSLRE
jgi:hypothetical protein